MAYAIVPMFSPRQARMLANMIKIDPPADMPLLNWSELSVSELPTGTVTLLLADVEGSTRLWETQSDTMTTALEQLNRTVNDRVAGYGGVRPVEQGEGDSLVAAFARASDAVGCALKLQLSVQRRSGSASACTPVRSSCATPETTPEARSTGPRACATSPMVGRPCYRARRNLW